MIVAGINCFNENYPPVDPIFPGSASFPETPNPDGSFAEDPWFGADPDAWGEAFGDAERTVSPIVLDLNGDGVQTTRLSKSLNAGTHFNLDAQGLAENTGWVSKDDGLLVRDLDGDGQITSGRELFGNHTLLQNGAKAANGFEALKELDDNADGVVDGRDAAFAGLRVWKDADGDGVTDAGELISLEAAGVKSIQVTYTHSSTTDAQGNQHLQLGNFTTLDGQTREMNDVWFAVDTARTVDRDLVSISTDIAALPNLAGLGQLVLTIGTA